MQGDHDDSRRKIVLTSRILKAQFKCETCGKIFISLDHLTRHRQKRHAHLVVNEDKSVQVRGESDEFNERAIQLIEASKRIENVLRRFEENAMVNRVQEQSGEPFIHSETVRPVDVVVKPDKVNVRPSAGRNFKTNFTLCDSKLSAARRGSDVVSMHDEDYDSKLLDQVRKVYNVAGEVDKLEDFGCQTSPAASLLKLDASTSLLDLFNSEESKIILSTESFFWCIEPSSPTVEHKGTTVIIESDDISMEPCRRMSMKFDEEKSKQYNPRLGVYRTVNVAIDPTPREHDRHCRALYSGSTQEKLLPGLKHFDGKAPLYHRAKNKLRSSRHNSTNHDSQNDDSSSVVSSLPHDGLSDRSNETLTAEKAVENLLTELEVWKSSESYTSTKKKFKKTVRFNLSASLHDVGVDSKKKFLNDVSTAEAHALIQNKRKLMYQMDKHYESLMKKITEEIDRLAKKAVNSKD